MMKKIVLLSFMLFPLTSNAEISRNNVVDWVAVSANKTNSGHFIQLKNALQHAGDCRVDSNHLPRVLLSADDKDLLSLFLTAKAANKKVGFYYKTSSTIPKASGHGLPDCEFVNVWLESE
ncbi:hypothetical protein L4174_023530 [Photobacterium sp. CCB-ST2H9]|uniref:hypothetical protein n=1 Tax=Photobacterium sp. CCB-ST2H9 TaxID=2912855 RepID=UPI0020066AA4|nr:hypothetical protein [Photobacterium sp. CCB-ST2H9]UTM59666.1 hypothetical protein L4174_023530 [Photobacterium sp. CCB-ST2H9]